MIVRPRLHWLRMLFVWRGSVLPRILPQLAFTTVLAAWVVWTHGQLGNLKLTLTSVPFSLIGVAIAIFMGFRNNASYERFWEARKIWGALLNDCRSLARQVMTLGDFTPQEKRRLIYGIAAFVHALRHQLRDSDPTEDLKRLIPAEDFERVKTAAYKPAVVLALLGEWFAEARRGGRLDPILVPAIESNLSGLSHELGACERIANTPIPYTYSVIIHRTIYLYCILLPFGLVDSIGLMTPLIVAFISYTFFALEALSDEIEEPFGFMPNDLALDALSTTIERTLRETLGEKDLPEPVKPHDFVLH